MIIAFKNKSLRNFYSKKENRLFSDVSDHWIPLYKELGYPVTTLDKVKGKYIYYDNVRKYSHDIIQNNEFKLLSDKVKDDINNDKCFYIINDSEIDLSGGNWIDTYPLLLKEAGIKPNKCKILTSKYNILCEPYKSNVIKTYHWDIFEKYVQNHNQPEIVKVLDDNPKKFLCLNRSHSNTIAKSKSMFMYKVMPMIEDFNASINNGVYDLVYDVKFKQRIDNGFASKDNDLSYWSRENCINIVTESACHSIDNTNNGINITEKTYKAIMLKMPFILVGTQYSLKVLKQQGYKTFNNLWDESYDNIYNFDDRINAVVELVKELRTKNLKKLVLDNLDILEHNYNNFISRKSKLKDLKKDIERWFNDVTPESTSNP